MKKIIWVIAAMALVVSCKDDNEVKNTEGSVFFKFTNKVGDADLSIDTDSYTNLSDETYTVSELKYIISNIVLIDENDEEFVYPVENSYFLIDEAVTPSKLFNLVDIPLGEYTKVRFGFGVDQTNYPLNGVANFIPTAEESGMLWSWSAGYKFLKFEGSYAPQGGLEQNFILHIGSHGTTLDNYKEITLELPTPIEVVGGSDDPTIFITADIAKIFDGVNTHALSDKSDIQVDPVYAPILAENVQSMFSIN